jgi:hypothetical protein
MRPPCEEQNGAKQKNERQGQDFELGWSRDLDPSEPTEVHGDHSTPPIEKYAMIYTV